MNRLGIILSIFLSLFFTAQCGAYDRAIRVRDGREITFAQMMKEIRGADFVFVGESHSSVKHHRLQLAVINALHERDVSMSVGLEMFKAKSQKDLDLWISGSLDSDRFIRSYYANWGLPWALYNDIFLYAREHSIPMVGLNVPGEIISKVSQKGFSSLTPEELKQLPPGISCSIDSRYMDFIRKVYKGHNDGRAFLHFCEAQMVWDKAMAFRLVEYLKKNQGRTVVVLAGTGHAWKRGIPEQVKGLSGFRSVVILPEAPGHVEKSTATADDADYIVLD